MMRFRYPDDPMRVSLRRLEQISADPPGSWLAQVKVDDWRRPAYLSGGEVTFASKNGGARASIQPPDDLVREFMSLSWPDDMAIDMGWVGRRRVDVLRGENYLVLFDLLYQGGHWQGDVPFAQRHRNLSTILALARAGVKAPRIRLSRTWDRGFAKLFEKQKDDPISEGLVLRRANSGLIGDFRKRRKNPAWIKVKYRDINEPAAF